MKHLDEKYKYYSMEENNSEVEREIESLEFSLDEEEINELIELLKNLKESKDKFGFDIDDENELIIHYDDSE